MTKVLPLFLVVSLLCACRPEATLPSRAAAVPLSFQVRVREGLTTAPVQGRVLVLIATRAGTEPREQVTEHDNTAQVFGLDAKGVDAEHPVVLAGNAVGAPVTSLASLPAGDYFVQAVLNRYETYHRADGKTLELPPDQGEGQVWSTKPNNLVSTPRRVHLDPANSGQVPLELDHLLPPVPARKETKYVRHVSIRSEKLTKFWGRPVFIGATVLLPEGFDAHPTAHYPLIIAHGHFAEDQRGFRETPPDAKLPAIDVAGIGASCRDGHGPLCEQYGYSRFVQEHDYAFAQQWKGAGFPRVILVQLEHANPFYDDSYAVNSANVGPYGDALVEEILPALEQQFRGLGPWARGMLGGSTGGWETLADQVFYPDAFNGAIASCPDPVDFHNYQSANLYDEPNAYFTSGPFRRTPRPASRTTVGHSLSTMEQDNLMELALGTHSRSGQQFDIWEAVYSPVGEDGYPKRVYDKRTGQIDPSVVSYWRDHYDLTFILQRDWATLGPKLQGKIQVNVGRMDAYFLDGAVYRLEAFLKSTTNPASDAKFEYGTADGHCWSGDHVHPNFMSRLTYPERMIPELVKHFLQTAPRGADVKSWRY